MSLEPVEVPLHKASRRIRRALTRRRRNLLVRHCRDGRKVALFVTHRAPEDEPEVPEWMTKFKVAASGANLVGFFDCHGEISKGVHFIMSISTKKKVRTWAKLDNSKIQPDEARLMKARTFARETLNRMV